MKILGSHAHNAGFTLIDMILTAAVIALSAAITISALSIAAENDKVVLCVENMRLINRANQLYMEDFDGFFPDYGVGEGNRWQDRFAEMGYGPGKESEAWYCPSNTAGRSFSLFIGYGYNYRVLGSHLEYTLEPDLRAVPARSEQINDPSRTLTFVESKRWNPGHPQHLRGVYIASSREGITDRAGVNHEGLINLARVDGSVNSMSITGYNEETEEGSLALYAEGALGRFSQIVSPELNTPDNLWQR